MVIFVTPAYNEEQNIGRLIEETDARARRSGLTYRLVVVDDGSSDRTAEIVKEKSSHFPCVLVSYQPNLGVGKAFRQGLKTALSLAAESDVIVTQEADGTSDPAILPLLLGRIASGADVALASCYAPGGEVQGLGWGRVFLSRSANMLIFILFHIRGVHTYSSFYRAYRPSALQRVLSRYGDFYEETGFACVVELLIRLAKLGVSIEEVPMRLQSSQRVGKSKMQVGRTILGYLRVIRRNVFR